MTSKKDTERAQIKRRDEDRASSNEKAQRSAGWYSDDAYMSELGKEGTKRQQEHMKDDADQEDTKQQYSRKHGITLKGAGSYGTKRRSKNVKTRRKAQGKP